MNMLTRWEPFREVRRVHNMLDQMMDRAFLGPTRMAGFEEGMLTLDVIQTDDDVIVKATMPGVKPEDIEISISGDELNIRGKVAEERAEEGQRYFLRERRFGSFSRTITLPTIINGDDARAEFENGELSLTLPKIEQVKPKPISVKVKK